jgi:hypothetical protein
VGLSFSALATFSRPNSSSATWPLDPPLASEFFDVTVFFFLFWMGSYTRQHCMSIKTIHQVLP